MRMASIGSDFPKRWNCVRKIRGVCALRFKKPTPFQSTLLYCIVVSTCKLSATVPAPGLPTDILLAIMVMDSDPL